MSQTLWVAVGCLTLGAALWWWSRRGVGRWELEALRRGLRLPLARQLWRQSLMPQIGTPGGSALLPILGFELYSAPMRAIYDRSRALDAALLRVLLRDPEDRARLEHVERMQRRTRAVRRALMLSLMAQSGAIAGPEAELEALEDVLDEVERGVDQVPSGSSSPSGGSS